MTRPPGRITKRSRGNPRQVGRAPVSHARPGDVTRRACEKNVRARDAATRRIAASGIGAGIFKAPAIVDGLSGSAEGMFGMWILGGLVSLAGALCYAELATSCAHPGGGYHFLRRAYGRPVAFLFGWARFSVITTGSIALLAFVFGDYMQQAWPVRGLRSGAATQSWLTLAEVGGLLLLAAAAALFAAPGPAQPAPVVAGPVSFGMAMVFVLPTYGGWNEAAYISAEVRGGPHGIVRALTLSVLIITVLYLLVTWACWKTLGMQGMAASNTLAADVMRKTLGSGGEKVMSLLVALSALTSINATMIVGARSGYAMGCDWQRLRWLGHWDGERGTPAVAMLVQGLAALLLVGLGAAFGSGFKAMQIAKVGKKDVLFDLGCGDGRIVVTAAKTHGARGTGIDLDPERIREARKNAEQAGVGEQVNFRVADLFETDVSAASVVTLYLLPNVNTRLRPRLWKQLKVGARVVSHAFDMGPEWPPEKTESVEGRTIYYWTIKAAHKRAVKR